MKKSLIAGAGVAAFAMAAVPFAGVFAAASNPSNLVDTLNVTIEDSCTWTRALTTADQNVTIGTGTAATATASRTMTADQSIAAFAVSTINAKCNNTKGYKITGTFDDLVGQVSSSDTTKLSNNEKIAYGGAAELASGTWIAKLGSSTTGLASGTSGNVASTTASDNMTSGSEYVITYGVATAAAQPAGYYTGSATYVFAQNS